MGSGAALKRFFASAVIVSLGVAPACSAADGPESGEPSSAPAATSVPLSRAVGLAHVEPSLARILAPTKNGWRSHDDSFAFAGNSLGARMPLAANGQLEVGNLPDPAHRLQLAAKDAEPRSVGLLDQGRVVFEGAYPATDLVVAGESNRVEELLVLRDSNAPRRFAWAVTLGTALHVDRSAKAEDGIRILDDKGVAVLRIPPAFALDRTGTRRDATLNLNENELVVQLDTTGLEFPILLDPAIESYVWEQMADPPSGLDYRFSPLAFDNRVSRNVVVLYGGQLGGAVYQGDTWEYQGTTWTRKCDLSVTPCGPGPRSFHALAFVDNVGVLMFGGKPSSGGAPFGDTWLWNGTGTAWAQQCAACGPPARAYHAMAHHSGYGTVLFGGLDSTSTRLDDTWVWNGSAWTQKCTSCVTGSTKPSARSDHAMAYDAAHNKVVLFGGITNPGSTKSSETWLWDATSQTWSQACVGCVDGSTRPEPRGDPAMAYDSRRGKVVLFGGWNTGTTNYGDTWEWDGTVWTKVASSGPVGRNTAGMAYDSNRGRAVMYGGVYNGQTTPTNQVFEYHARGGACTSASQCDTGYCVDGVCCEVSICPVCNSCDQNTSGNIPGLCGAILNAEDPSGCSGTSQCDAASVCKLKSGQTCTAGSQCVSGNCVDGTCCADTCTTPCRSCANATGTCTTIVANQHDNCATPNICNAAGDCKKENGQTCGSSTECASGNCVDGTCCADSCTTPCRSCANASGTCTTVISNADDPVYCAGLNSCDASGTCKKKNSQGCSTGTECVSGNCADGYCCDSACSGGCDVCASSLGASQNGVCTVLGAGAAGQCSPYKCAGAASCPTTCATDTQCASGFFCDSGACSPLKTLGTPCTGNNQCTSTFCADGVCCNTACTGKCMACAAGNKQDTNPANSGTCNAAKQGTNPGSQCVLSTDPCGDQDFCSGTPGQCALGASGKSCGPTTCVNGNVTGKICNGAGLCTDQTNVTCTPYVCKSGACSSPCGADTDCVTNYYCSNGACIPKLDNGGGCSAANACKSGFCVDVVCCDAPCSGQCEACAETSSLGTCKVVSGKPRGQRPDCQGATGDACKGACDGSSPNVCSYPASGTDCKAASCTGDVLQPAGTCDGAGLCSVPPTANCAPYACDGTSGACKAACSSDTDCSQGAKCDTATGKCAVTSATCKDESTVLLPNGQSQSCLPYKCVGGACQQQCATQNDCATGYVCVSNACVAPEGGNDAGVGGTTGTGGVSTGGVSTGGTGGSGTGGASTGGSGASASGGKKSSDGGDSGGCGCRVPARRSGSSGLLLGLLALAALGGRRRRAKPANLGS